MKFDRSHPRLQPKQRVARLARLQPVALRSSRRTSPVVVFTHLTPSPGHAGAGGGAFRVVQRDTMSFSIIDMVNLFGEKDLKFFSFDAGYTVQHALNDLALVQEVGAWMGCCTRQIHVSALARSN
jgi:hypothetical protein